MSLFVSRTPAEPVKQSKEAMPHPNTCFKCFEIPICYLPLSLGIGLGLRHLTKIILWGIESYLHFNYQQSNVIVSLTYTHTYWHY